ncbi:stage III sporulation protein AF [Clostridium bornimense]|uniref:Stage III sporulation protein AF n=1 Tax=Clostridium bornimense TaxID=1216932 RepID=W6RW53_9CLOT|nr:stage III sporulation protein AF [Clostridium bornimense]CDM68618.1 stage III sporulation protein AF [Clostridium bornimense]
MLENIKNYILIIAVAIVFFSTVRLLLPNNSLKKYINLVFGLLLIGIVIDPITKFMLNTSIDKEVNDFYDNLDKKYSNTTLNTYAEKDKDLTMNTFKNNLDESIKNLLKKNFQNIDFEVDTKVQYKDKEVLIENVSVTYYSGMVKPIEKVTIGEVKEKDEHLDKEGTDIEKFLCDELKIDSNKINIIKG